MAMSRTIATCQLLHYGCHRLDADPTTCKAMVTIVLASLVLAIIMCCSFIRKVMVSTMFEAVQGRDPELHECPAGFLKGVEGHDELENEWGDHAFVPTPGPRNAIESAAGACVLWCTVAVGCLVGGQPKSSVSPACSAIVFSMLLSRWWWWWRGWWR